MHQFLVNLIVIVVILLSTNTYANSIKVVFINPGHPEGDATGAFWSNVNRFMRAAANDLDIELNTLYAQRNHILMKTLATSVVKHKPDYAIIVNEKGAGLDMVKTIAQHDIPIFMLLNSFNDAELQELNDNQTKLIKGHLIPDNFLAGKNMMSDLVALHQKKNSKSFSLLALQGDYRSAASLERKQGLTSYLENNKQINLIDMPTANWSEQEAYQKVKGLLKRQQIDLIWAANDPMAIGARKAVNEAKLSYPVTIGGFNWDAPNTNYPLDVSYGGHVTLGAKALIMLSEFHNNQRQPCEMFIKKDIFKAACPEKLGKFIANTQGKNIEQIDFRKFSRVHPDFATFDLGNFIDVNYQKYADNSEISNCQSLANNSSESF